jgi:Secretion system C-terminal sorting domain
MVLLIFLLNFTSSFAQQFPMDKFIGVNLRREDPIQFLKPFGFVRDYREWAVDEGNFIKSVPDDSVRDINKGKNRYKWNPGYGSYEKFDEFYTKINNQLGNGNICATMKSCLPYLSGGDNDDFLEFKPVRTTWTGTRVNSGNTIKANIPITLMNNTTTPSSYAWISDWIFQFTLKYGAGMNVSDKLKRDGTESTNRNTNQVKYIELWNEQDKYWKKVTGVQPVNDGWLKATQFSGEEYAAMASAVYDAHNSTIFVKNDSSQSSTTQYNPGIKFADSNMKFAMGGTAGIRQHDWRFIIKMKEWFEKNRTTGVKMPINVINFHHYNCNQWQGLEGVVDTKGRTAVSPEEDRWGVGAITNVDLYGQRAIDEDSIINLTSVNPTVGTNRTFKQRLIELKDSVKINFIDKGYPVELWMSEFGFDTNEKSPYRAPNIKDVNGVIVADRQEVQGRFLVRGYLEIASAGWDRAMLYDLRDLDSGTDSKLFDGCGVVKDKNTGYQPKKSYYYVGTLAQATKGTKFQTEVTLSGDPTALYTGIYANHSFNYVDSQYHRIVKFAKPNALATVAGDIVYAVWIPTSKNKERVNVPFYFDAKSLKNTEGVPTLVTMVSPLVGDVDGVNSSLTIQTDNTGKKYVLIPKITENPIYLRLGEAKNDPTVAQPTFTATGVSCDAIKLKIDKIANKKYSVYYYEKNDRDENGVVPAFNLDDPNLQFFKNDITASDVVVGGLNLGHDKYHVFVLAVDTFTNNISLPTKMEATTLSCSNNLVLTEADTATASLNIQEIKDIIDTKNFSLCYPIRDFQYNAMNQFFFSNKGFIDFVDASGNLMEYKLNLSSLWDAQGESDLKVEYCDACTGFSKAQTASIPAAKWKLLFDYKTIYYEKWIHFPTDITTNRIRITKSDDKARIRKLIFRGIPATSTAYKDSCCGANESNLKTITGNTTVSAQISNENMANTNNMWGQRQILKIDGNLTFDVGFYALMNNSVLYMSPGSQITVPNGQSLYSYYASIQGCDAKWNGIEVSPGGTAYIYNTNIRDAFTAIKLKSIPDNGQNTYCTVYQSVLEENLDGIRNENVNNTTSNTLNVISTVFDGNNRDLKSDNTNGAYSNSDKSMHGIYLEKYFNGIFGYPANQGYRPNVFQNLIIGISSNYYTDLTIVNTQFKNINSKLINSPGWGTFTYGGYGILKSGTGKLALQGLGILEQTSTTNASPITFDKVKMPISLSNSNFDIQNCKIFTTLDNSYPDWWYGSTTYGGIYATYDSYSVGTTNIIKNNKIYANGSGISVLNQNNPTRIEGNFIECNEISGLSSTVAGSSIMASSYTWWGTAPSTIYSILSNTINSNRLKKSNGIYLLGVNGATVNGNNVTSRDYESAQNTDSTFLINILSSFNNNIRNNTLTGTGGSFVKNPDGIKQTSYAVGINLTSAPQNNITCNSLKALRIGISADGSNVTGTSSGIDGIAGNVFEEYNRGILLRSSSASVGVHEYKMNRWKDIAVLASSPNPNSNPPTPPELTNKAAEFVGNTTIAQLQESLFRVRNNSKNGSNDSEINPTDVTGAVKVNTGLPTNWFVPQSTSATYTCASVGAGLLSGSSVAQTLQTRGDAESEFYAEGDHPFVNRKVVEDAAKMKKNMAISDASAWIMERDAYGYYKEKLKINLPSTKALKDFFKKHDNGDIGTLAELDNEWLKLKEEEYKEQAKEAAKATKRLEELSAAQNKQFEPKKLAELKDAQKIRLYFQSFENDSIKILQKKLYDLDKDYGYKLAKKAKNLLSINNRLSSDVAYVKYEKEINDMYFTLLGDKTVKLTKEQVAKMIEIAMMCSEEAGRAPFKARALYATLTAEPLPDWSDKCRKKEVIRLAVGLPTLNISIYPNPAHDNITVSIEKMLDTEGYEWQITDIAGSSVKMGKFNNATETINTNALNSGIYLIRVVKDNSIVKVEKFSIIK